jgi:ABC-type nitrate/sulfonate/bicarbonate transport system substrate-binding protein
MMTTTRRLRLLAPVAALALLVTACGSDPAGPDGEDGDLPVIRVGFLGTGSMAPMMITAELFAEEEGFQVEMVQFPSGGEILTGVVTGDLDVGAAGIGSGAYNSFHEGLPFRMVAPQHNGYVEDYFMLSAAVAGSQQEAAEVMTDLTPYAGETFTVNAPGVVTEYLLGLALERGGLSFDQVNVEYMPFPDMVPALAAGSVVGGIVSEPFPTAAEADGSGYRPFDTPAEPPLPFTTVIYNTDWAEENPDLAEAYMRAHLRSAQLLDERGWDDEEVLQIISDTTGLDPDRLRDNRPHHLPTDLSVDFTMVRTIQLFYLEQGTLAYDEIVDDTELWDLRWRDAALAQ